MGPTPSSVPFAVPLLAALAYLLGSMPFGLVLAKLEGIDLRTVGSGNIGATNAARALGKVQGLLVLVLDAAKGALPVLVAQRAFRHDAAGAWYVALVAFAAFAGHLFPVYLRFRGGKGVATALGVNVAVAPLATLVGAVLWAAVFARWRYSSLASLTASMLFPPLLWVLSAPWATVTLAAVMAPLILWKHRANIRRLWRGEESRV